MRQRSRPGEEDEVVVVPVPKDGIAGPGIGFDTAEQSDLVDQFVDVVEGHEAPELRPTKHLVEFSEELRGGDDLEAAVAEGSDERR
jgi:hypothetical protein